MRITAAGNVGIGVDPSAKLHVNGNTRVDGNITASGDVSATGNISATGNVSATGNISANGTVLAPWVNPTQSLRLGLWWIYENPDNGNLHFYRGQDNPYYSRKWTAFALEGGGTSSKTYVRSVQNIN